MESNYFNRRPKLFLDSKNFKVYPQGSFDWIDIFSCLDSLQRDLSKLRKTRLLTDNLKKILLGVELENFLHL